MKRPGYRSKLLFVMLVSFAFIRIPAQCPKTVLFFKGKFYPKIYLNNSYHFTIPEEGYTSCNGLLPGMMDSLSNKDNYTYEGEKDSIQVCSWNVNLFSKSNKWALFNREGHQATPFCYDYAFGYEAENRKMNDIREDHQLILVRIGKNWGLTTGLGKVITNVEYQLPGWNSGRKETDTLVFTETSHILHQDSANRCTDCKGPVKVYPLAGGYIVFVKNGKVGAVDSLGKTVVPFLYDSLFCSFEGCMEGSKSGKHIYLTQSGKEIIGYDEVHPILLGRYVGYNKKNYFSGIYLVKRKGMWGLVNSSNNQRIKTIFKIDSDGGHLEESTEVFTDAFIIDKKYYDLEIRLNAVSIKDEMGKEVLGTFLVK
jgi:hypothetical protein